MAELTTAAWDPSFTVEGVLLLVRQALLDGDGKLCPRRPHVPYGVNEAVAAFTRVARQHGWQQS